MAGRPTKLTARLAVIVLRALRLGAYIETAVAHAGLHKDTYYQWVKRGRAEGTQDANYRAMEEALQHREEWECAQAAQRLAEERAKAANVAPPAHHDLVEPKEFRARGAGAYLAFADAVEKALADAEMRNLHVIDRAKDTNWQAAAWQLERKYTERWGRRQRLEVGANIDAADDEVEISMIIRKPGAAAAAAAASVS